LEYELSYKKLNIAVIIASGLKSGGGYQYEYMVLDILKKHNNDKNISLKYYASDNKILKDYSDLNLDIKIINENIFQKFQRFCISNIFLYKLFSKIGYGFSSIEKKLLEDKIDLIYFISPNLRSQGLSNIPYIFTLWDLGHLEMPEFPEVSYERRFELREFIYNKSLKKAVNVIVDSDYSKQYTIDKYILDQERVKVLRYLPNIRAIESSQNIVIKQKYNLNNDYIFYPAQFWAHKNHIYILEAIKILRKEQRIDVDVVFSGSDKGNLRYILDKAKELEIEDLIHYIGFAPNDEIPLLYRQSLALVMPTYLGPTNIPPLEAFAYQTPVCYSDTPFFREQVGDAVFYMDLKDPLSLVQNLMTIKNDKKITNDKIDKGKAVLENWNDKDFYNELLKIFNDFKYLRNRWK
jgi:glycosyltransferase involved in cell wall biosynthesis